MRIRSLRARLGLFWVLIVAICISLGLIMLEVYRQGAGVQVDDAKRATARACSAIRDGYARSQPPTADDQAINADLLNVVLQLRSATTATASCTAAPSPSRASSRGSKSSARARRRKHHHQPRDLSGCDVSYEIKLDTFADVLNPSTPPANRSWRVLRGRFVSDEVSATHSGTIHTS